jgi:hypothetical protein
MGLKKDRVFEGEKRRKEGMWCGEGEPLEWEL